MNLGEGLSLCLDIAQESWPRQLTLSSVNKFLLLASFFTRFQGDFPSIVGKSSGKPSTWPVPPGASRGWSLPFQILSQAKPRFMASTQKRLLGLVEEELGFNKDILTRFKCQGWEKARFRKRDIPQYNWCECTSVTTYLSKHILNFGLLNISGPLIV